MNPEFFDNGPEREEWRRKRGEEIERELYILQLRDEVAKRVYQALTSCRTQMHSSEAAQRQYELLLNQAQALIHARERQHAYRCAFWPALVVGVVVWALMVISLFAAVPSDIVFAARPVPFSCVFVFLWVGLVVGRLADIATTLAAMGLGATELNPSLPERVTGGHLVRPTAIQVVVLSSLSGIAAMVTLVIIPFLVQQKGADEFHPLVLALARHPSEAAVAIAGAFLAVPAIVSFGAALHNMVHVIISAQRSSVLRQRAEMAYCANLSHTPIGSTWADIGSPRRLRHSVAGTGGILWSLFLLLMLLVFGIGLPLFLTGWVLGTPTNGSAPLAALAALAYAFYILGAVLGISGFLADLLPPSVVLHLPKLIPTIVSTLVAAVPFAILWRVIVLS